jgi:hypothetical protein
MSNTKTYRFYLEAEYELEPKCRCCSCWEPTGKWLVCDKEDQFDDIVFQSKEEALNYIKNNLDQGDYHENA